MHTLMIPIVGLRHYVSDVDAMLRELTPGEEIMLVPERGNRRDQTAIAAYREQKQIGYVSSDFTEIIRLNYPDARAILTEVVENLFAIEDNAFYVSLDIEQLVLDIPQPQIPCEGLHGIALPDFNPQRELQRIDIERRLDELEEYFDGVHVDEEVVERLIDTARRFSTYYAQSLSGDDKWMYIRLMNSMTAAMTYWTSNNDELYEQMLGLADTRREFANDSKKAAAIMEQEMEGVRKEMVDFNEEIEALIRSGLVTREQLAAENDSWLRALPQHLYAHVENKEELATRLLYLRLSTAELMAVYAHIVWREQYGLDKKVKKTSSQKVQDETTKEEGFHYWATQHVPIEEQRNAIAAMRDIVENKTRYAKPLLDKIDMLQKRHVLAKDLTPTTQFVAELNALLQPCKKVIRYSTMMSH